MTATDYDFISTRNEIVIAALIKVGAVAMGSPVQADVFNHAVDTLNRWVKSLQNRHTFLWTVQGINVAMTDSVASYSFTDPPIIGINRAWYRVSGVDTPIEVHTWRYYENEREKLFESSQPEYVTFDNKQSGKMYVWPVPSSTINSVYIEAVIRQKDLQTAAAFGDFTTRWQTCLVFGLTHQLCGDFPVSLAERKYFEDQFEKEFKFAKTSDTDTADYEEEVASLFPFRRC